MNWVLVLVMYWNGVTSQQVGPYTSHADCERAFAVIESQDTSFVRQHYCVPRPYSSTGQNATLALPKEFD